MGWKLQRCPPHFPSGLGTSKMLTTLSCFNIYSHTYEQLLHPPARATYRQIIVPHVNNAPGLFERVHFRPLKGRAPHATTIGEEGASDERALMSIFATNLNAKMNCIYCCSNQRAPISVSDSQLQCCQRTSSRTHSGNARTAIHPILSTLSLQC